MSRPVRALLPVALVAALLTGCAPADPLGAAARETIRSLAALDQDDLEAAVISIATRAEALTWLEWGVDPEVVATAVEPLGDAILDERKSPSGVQLASAAAGVNSVASAFGIGFLAIGEFGKMGVDHSNSGTRGSDTTEVTGGSATISVGADGTVETTYSAGGTEGDLSVAIAASSEIQPCPDASGTVELSADVSVRVSLGTAGGSIELEVDATGRLDDSAALSSSEYTYRQQHSQSQGGKGEFLDHSGNSAGEVTANRWSSEATTEFVQGAAEMAAGLAAMVAHDLFSAAQDGWMSGRCVEVTLSPSEDPGSLEPEADITVEAVPRSVLDGSETGGTLVATLTGEGSLASSGDRLSAPETLDYRAPSEKDRSGTVAVESRSNRGVGRASILLSTGGGAYVADVTVDEYTASATICSLTEPFEIPGSGLTFSFTPASEDQGTFQMTGGRYDLTFAGDGEYSVTRNSDDVATTLHASGDSTLTTPEGHTAESPIDLTYTLTPTEPCD